MQQHMTINFDKQPQVSMLFGQNPFCDEAPKHALSEMSCFTVFCCDQSSEVQHQVNLSISSQLVLIHASWQNSLAQTSQPASIKCPSRVHQLRDTLLYRLLVMLMLIMATTAFNF
eukprot:6467138-Amphidinium_carterae.1